MAKLTNDLMVYGDSTPSFVVRLADGPTESTQEPLDLRLYSITADIDDPNGTRVAGWTITYGDQDDPEFRGLAVLDLAPAAVAALWSADGRTFSYDVRFRRTADGAVFFCPERSKLSLTNPVTEGTP